MSALGILDLNDDCLYYLLSQLTDEEQLSFTQVCQRFRQLFVARHGYKLREFTLHTRSTRQELIALSICCEQVQQLTIDLDNSNALHTVAHSSNCCLNCFTVLCATLQRMWQLQRLVVQQLHFMTTPVPQPFEKILAAVRHLPHLQQLKLKATNEWTCNNVQHLQHLEQLQLHIQHNIEADILIKCCKASSRLRILDLGYGCVQRQLVNIVPHCAQLEILRFGMTAEATDYAKLAKLPKLRQLSHCGIRRSGCFVPLLQALVAPQQLQLLEIDGGSLNMEETLQLVRLRSLQQLKCFFSNAGCVAMLAHLKHLQQLSFWMTCQEDITQELLAVVAGCRQLQVLRVAVARLSKYFLADVVQVREQQQQPLQLE
ncbi:CG12520, partial [Drosophila busckii]